MNLVISIGIRKKQVIYISFVIKRNFMMICNEVIKEYLDNADIKYDEEELKEVIDYQNLVIPHFKSEETIEHHFNYNIPEYFDTYFSEKRRGLTNKPSGYDIN